MHPLKCQNQVFAWECACTKDRIARKKREALNENPQKGAPAQAPGPGIGRERAGDKAVRLCGRDRSQGKNAK